MRIVIKYDKALIRRRSFDHLRMRRAINRCEASSRRRICLYRAE